jgi:hypothetical protein
MRTLDCESIDSTYVSIEEILRIERPLLEEMLGNLDLEEACRRAGGKTGSEVLLEAVVKHARASPDFDKTCWFHFSRSHPRNSFSKGILPLREALPFVWGFLLMLLPEEFPLDAWYRFAKNPPSQPYRRKLNDPANWGSFALLPREAGLSCREFGTHDSLGVPEIVGDICSAFQEEHDFDLLRVYRENTRPCVVKFIGNKTSPGHVATALHYLYRHLHGARFAGDCRVDFDAKGEAITPERIRKVEFL